MGKHRSNPRYFKEKKLQSGILTSSIFKKVKSIKIIFLKKIKWKKKENNFGKKKEGKLEKK